MQSKKIRHAHSTPGVSRSWSRRARLLIGTSVLTLALSAVGSGVATADPTDSFETKASALLAQARIATADFKVLDANYKYINRTTLYSIVSFGKAGTLDEASSSWKWNFNFYNPAEPTSPNSKMTTVTIDTSTVPAITTAKTVTSTTPQVFSEMMFPPTVPVSTAVTAVKADPTQVIGVSLIPSVYAPYNTTYNIKWMSPAKKPFASVNVCFNPDATPILNCV